ncbi:MAG: TIGR04255 family protein [Candidatus Scalindua sp.]
MFGFPEAERSGIESHKRHYLNSVIFQVKFNKTDEIDKNKEEITSIFKDLFPRVHKTKREGIRISIAGNKTSIVQPVSHESFGFEVKSTDGQNIISFGREDITLIISGGVYKDYNNICDKIPLLIRVFGLCEIISLNRVAIRKLNTIDFEIAEGSKTSPIEIADMLLNPNLLISSAYLPQPENIQQNIQTINYTKNYYRLNLRYGLIVSEVNAQKGQILIDIDLFRVDDVSVDSLESVSTEINREIFNIFSWAISEEAKDQLRK